MARRSAYERGSPRKPPRFRRRHASAVALADEPRLAAAVMIAVPAHAAVLNAPDRHPGPGTRATWPCAPAEARSRSQHGDARARAEPGGPRQRARRPGCARPWPALLSRRAALPATSWRGTRYGEATLGYALLQAGARSDNRAQIHAGLKAIDSRWPAACTGRAQACSRTFGSPPPTTSAKRSLRHDPTFKRARPRWDDSSRRASSRSSPAAPLRQPLPRRCHLVCSS
jgi:hypothetical protein